MNLPGNKQPCLAEEITACAPPEIVVEAVLNYLSQQNFTGAKQPQLKEPPYVIRRPWSTLYFLTIQISGEIRKLVVKIVRFDDQKTAEISWQSKNLLTRGRCEFETMTRVFDHFTTQSNPILHTLRPVAYLPEINAIVMDFSDGARMNDYITIRHLLSFKGLHQSQRIMNHTGQWLRSLHKMPRHNMSDMNLFSTSDIFQELLNKIDKLHDLGVDIYRDIGEKTLTILKHVSHDIHVWNHGDFISGNMLVFADDSVLGLDVVMERVDSPYYDLGRFVGDLKTRRSTILRLGRLPSPKLMNTLRDAFLTGYFKGEQYNKLLLAIYEGYFICSEWVDMLMYLQDRYTGRKTILSGGITRAVINPTFHRIIKQWAETVREAANVSLARKTLLQAPLEK